MSDTTRDDYQDLLQTRRINPNALTVASDGELERPAPPEAPALDAAQLPHIATDGAATELETLTGELPPADYLKEPALPPSPPETRQPDPS